MFFPKKNVFIHKIWKLFLKNILKWEKYKQQKCQIHEGRYTQAKSWIMPIQKDEVISHSLELGHWKHHLSTTNIFRKKKKIGYNSFSKSCFICKKYLEYLHRKSPTDSFSENKYLFNT